MPYKYLGNFSAVDPAYSRGMDCYDCEVSWTGCWDNFQCPRCGKGELPSCDISEPTKVEIKSWYAKYIEWYRARLKEIGINK